MQKLCIIIFCYQNVIKHKSLTNSTWGNVIDVIDSLRSNCEEECMKHDQEHYQKCAEVFVSL